MMPRIVCIHLLNDFSGSTRVLSQTIRALRAAGCPVVVHTSSNTRGFLDGLDVEYRLFSYRRSTTHKAITFARLLDSQRALFLDLFRYRNEEVTFLVNTLLPFGGGAAGRMLGKRVVYHVHETSLRPLWLKRFLSNVAHRTAAREIYVSQYLLQAEGAGSRDAVCIPNSVAPDLAEDAKGRCPPAAQEHFNVLMLCSPRDFKGVPEFARIARELSGYAEIQFDLVLNGSHGEVATYVEQLGLPSSVKVHAGTRDVATFYRRAHLVLNLSRPSEWVETFGLTLVEAMVYGVPVIAPPVGGPTEIVDHERNGLLIASSDTKRIAATILSLFRDSARYSGMSTRARQSSARFEPATFDREIVRAILDA